MIKQTKKVISIILVVMLIVTCISALIVTADAATQKAEFSLLDSQTFKVNATSNLSESVSETYSENDGTVNIKMYFKSSEAIANGEFEIKYDPAKLSFSSSNYNDLGIIKITPAVSEVGGVIVNEEPVGTIIGSFTSPIDFYDFSEEKVMFNVTFDIIGTGETTVDFNMLEMDAITPGTGNKKMMVLNGQPLDLFTQSAKATLAVSGSATEPVTRNLTVTSSSNIADSCSKTYSENDTNANIKLYFQSSESIANGEFEIIYDPTKLSFSSSNYDNSGIIKITPAISEVGGVVVNEKPVGTIIGSFSSPIDFYDFSEEKVMFDITFDIIGTGETTVDFNLLEMDAITPGTGNKKMMVLNGQTLDLFNQSAKASFTSAKDQPTTKKLTVVSSSNIAESFSYTYSENDTTANIKLYFKSDEAIANGEFEIKYDPTKLSFSNSNYDNSGIIKITPAISEVGGVVVNEKPVGTIIGSFSSPIDFYDFSEEKVMFDITFDIIGTGETEVDFNMLEMDAITPGTGNKKMMVLNGQVLDLFTQSAKASFTPSEKPIPEVFIGDADGDNTITVKDATSIQMYCATFQNLTEQQLLNADADGDNLVTIKDATHIQMYCAGFITEL